VSCICQSADGTGGGDNDFGTRRAIRNIGCSGSEILSFDAPAVGVSFSLLKVPLLEPVVVIGVLTFALCLPTAWFGRRLGAVTAKRPASRGGVILATINLKSLVEHLSAFLLRRD